MTNGKFVSRILNDLKLLNKDEHVSRRHILSVGQEKAKHYIAQKLLDKSLFREANLFRTIECLEMEELDTIKCGIYEFSRCESLRRSKHKIPALIYNRLGGSIVSVTSLDGSVEFLPITLKSFPLSRLRKEVKQLGLKYFYLQDEYLYLPDTEIEIVTLTYIPYDESEVGQVCGCTENELLKTIWDYEFIVPDKLSEQVISETLQELSVGRQIVTDEYPNLDSNEKTSPKP